MAISPQVRETAPEHDAAISPYFREIDACPKCHADHATVQPAFSCTEHGHAFVYVETVDGEDHDECPETGCNQGMWTS